jgi:hypothetical protein
METELQDLLAYYGQAADSESSKPEDFFGLVMSFSIALRVRLRFKPHPGAPLTLGFLCTESRPRGS